MKFIKVKNRRGFNHNHGTKYVVIDLERSNEIHNFEAGANRMPRDSKFWSHLFVVWDVEAKSQIFAEVIVKQSTINQNQS